MTDKCPGNGKPLLLSSGNIARTLNDPLLKLSRFLHNKIVSLGHFGCMNDFFHSRLTVAEADILLDRTAEQIRFLGDKSDPVTEMIDVHVPDVHSVHQNPSR